ncbi:MAG: hypothetical protein ACFHX7_12540 [Pseudomonadota bacterium]
MEQTLPPTLGEAIATEPAWLQAWVMTLVLSNLLAILFVVGRENGKWTVRYEPIAIVASFIAAGVLMGWMYGQFGYVRLLGLAHLVFWTPVYIWVLTRRKAIGTASLYGKYIVLYLVIAGTSLVIDGG